MNEEFFEIFDHKIMCNICNKNNIFRVRGSKLESFNGDSFILDLDQDKTRICENCGCELKND